MERGRGSRLAETEVRDRGSLKGIHVRPSDRPVRTQVWRPDDRLLTPLEGRTGPGSQSLWGKLVQVSRGKEPSSARSQGRTLWGPLGAQDIQVVTAFSPARPLQACGTVSSPACLEGSWLGGMLALRRAKLAAEGGA